MIEHTLAALLVVNLTAPDPQGEDAEPAAEGETPPGEDAEEAEAPPEGEDDDGDGEGTDEPGEAEEPAATEDAEPDAGSAPPTEAGETPKTPYQRRVEESPFDRTGWVVQGIVGFGDCFGGVCKQDGWAENPQWLDEYFAGQNYVDVDMKLGPLVKFEFGYRPIPYVDVTTGFTGHYQPMRGGLNSHKSFAIAYNWMFNVNAYPVAFGRMDPYVGLGLGFYQMWSHEDDDTAAGQTDTTMHLDRGLFRVSVGLDIFITNHFAWGPRFDINVPFAGELCSDVDPTGPNVSECTDVADLGGFKDDLPKAWEVGFAFKGRL